MRYCLALDLQDDQAAIHEYEKWHHRVWPEVEASIREAGITEMHIYRTGNRLFMIIDASESFSFERKAEQDRDNSKVVEWEELMWNYQKALPWAKEGEKWIVMKHIFSL
jgi:L-rhamnose mutarotase